MAPRGRHRLGRRHRAEPDLCARRRQRLRGRRRRRRSCIRPTAASPPGVRQISPTLAPICVAITFRSPNNGWAVGVGGRVLRTNNGGASWFFGTSGDRHRPQRCRLRQPLRGLGRGRQRRIRHTVNGGATWSDQGPRRRRRADAHRPRRAAAPGSPAPEARSRIRPTAARTGTTPPRRPTVDLWALSVNGADVRIAGARGFFSRAVDGATFMPAWETVQAQTIFDIVSSPTPCMNGWAVGGAGTDPAHRRQGAPTGSGRSRA